MPSREQWAYCYIEKYKNFGARVTLPTESANLSVKIYILNGRSDIFALVETIKPQLEEQKIALKQKSVAEAMRSKLNYLLRRYFGTLPLKFLCKGLEHINREYRYAKAAMPSSKSLQGIPLTPCDEYCTAPLQYGVPCRHKIYSTLVDGGQLRLWDVHHHWHLKKHLLSSQITVSGAVLTLLGCGRPVSPNSRPQGSRETAR